jgi:hypothetical protein
LRKSLSAFVEPLLMNSICTGLNGFRVYFALGAKLAVDEDVINLQLFRSARQCAGPERIPIVTDPRAVAPACWNFEGVRFEETPSSVGKLTPSSIVSGLVAK